MPRSLCLALVALAALFVTAGAASAQEADLVEASETAHRPVGPALAYSASLTAIPVALGVGLMASAEDSGPALLGLGLIVAGGVFGPSAGSVSLGDWRRARHGAAARALGAGALLGGAVYRFQACWEGCPDGVLGATNVAMAAGAGAIVYGLGYSVFTLDRSAQVAAGVGPSGVSVRVQL